MILSRRAGPPFLFFFNDTATTEIYTLSLHDALPISRPPSLAVPNTPSGPGSCLTMGMLYAEYGLSGLMISSSFLVVVRSEEHTSELQSQSNLVCRLLLEKKKVRLRPCRQSPAR